MYIVFTIGSIYIYIYVYDYSCKVKSRDSSVDIPIGYGWTAGVRFLAGKAIFSYSTTCRPALVPIRQPIQWIPGATFTAEA
jgi:hypothetical protein